MIISDIDGSAKQVVVARAVQGSLVMRINTFVLCITDVNTCWKLLFMVVFLVKVSITVTQSSISKTIGDTKGSETNFKTF